MAFISDLFIFVKLVRIFLGGANGIFRNGFCILCAFARDNGIDIAAARPLCFGFGQSCP